MNPTTRQVVAFHEAGHAVVARELGANVAWVELNADSATGFSSWAGGACHCDRLSSTFDDVVIDVAGVLASTFKFGPGADPMSPDGDLAGVGRVPPNERVRAVERASGILHRHWADVEALATKLLDDPDGFVPIPFAPDYHANL